MDCVPIAAAGEGVNLTCISCKLVKYCNVNCQRIIGRSI